MKKCKRCGGDGVIYTGDWFSPIEDCFKCKKDATVDKKKTIRKVNMNYNYKAWIAFYKEHPIRNTCAETSNKCFKLLTDEQRSLYYDRYEGKEGIEIRKVLFQHVKNFNSQKVKGRFR